MTAAAVDVNGSIAVRNGTDQGIDGQIFETIHRLL